jgi:hypothetical protein
MIRVACRAGCDRPEVDVDVSATLLDDRFADKIELAGFMRCEHCQGYYCRIDCFTFHKAPADHPVPFTSRAAERMERRRLARLDAA